MIEREEVQPSEKGAEGKKLCRRCNTVKFFHEFYLNRTRKGLCAACKECMKKYSAQYREDNPDKVAADLKRWKKEHREEVKIYNANWREENPLYGANYSQLKKLKQKDATLKCRYGISLDQYIRLIEFQENRCAICKTDQMGGSGSWPVDHDHQTGKARGLLCHTCNRSLGCLGDNLEGIMKVVDYLLNHPIDRMFEQDKLEEVFA